jgi:formylglycine-generating enzyme required for sulfatase activity
MALVGRTCVDRYEAHLVVPTEAGAFERHPHFQRPPEGKPFEARSEAGVFPQAYISRNESQAACFAAAKRLCTFDEWRRACRGPRRQTFPFGMRDRKSACNSSKPHLLPQLFGGDTRTWKYDENFNSPLLNQKEGYLAKSGSFEECRTEEGTYDLVGNLHEWVSGIVTESLVEKLETDTVERRKQPWHVGNGIFVGGFYSTSAEHGPGCLNITIAHEPRYHDYSTGFRCCKAAILPELEPKKPKTKAKKADAPASPSVTAAPSLAPKKKPAAKKKPKAASAPAPTPPAP